MRVIFFLLIWLVAAPAETVDRAVAIMSRVAVNQDAAEAARAAFVYRQNVAIRLRDTHGQLMREEISEYQVMPGAQDTEKKLVKFSGRYQKDGSMASYDSESRSSTHDGFREEADSDLAHDLREDLTGDRKSRDGLAPELFPLTAREQRKYRFRMQGEEMYRGAAVYRIAFEPNSDESPWRGEALIDKADSQPMLVTTKLAKKFPVFVRTALGTNLQGLGFSVEYQKFDGGVWFPVSYGTEFRVHALFVYSRQVAISLVNSDFRRAEVRSSVAFEKVQ